MRSQRVGHDLATEQQQPLSAQFRPSVLSRLHSALGDLTLHLLKPVQSSPACVHARSLSHVLLFVTLWTVAHQACEYLWVAISSSCGSSPPSDQTCIFCVSCIGRWIFYH